jgi:hypothetical protein
MNTIDNPASQPGSPEQQRSACKQDPPIGTPSPMDNDSPGRLPGRCGACRDRPSGQGLPGVAVRTQLYEHGRQGDTAGQTPRRYGRNMSLR